MIQDIAPDRLDNSYKTCDPRPDDHILLFADVLCVVCLSVVRETI